MIIVTTVSYDTNCLFLYFKYTIYITVTGPEQILRFHNIACFATTFSNRATPSPEPQHYN